MKKNLDNIVCRFNLTTSEVDGKRWYEMPDGRYVPSVTTVLDSLKTEKLAEWRERVGQDEANRISNSAKIRGTNIHDAVESYLMTGKYPEHILPTTQALVNKLRPSLDNDIDNLRLVEGCLWSKTLRLAGRTDVIADYKGTLSVIDFKGSNRVKKEEHIENYFMQATAYSIMFEEVYQIPVKQIVIMIAVDQQFERPQIFVKEATKYVDKLVDCVHDFHQKRVEEDRRWKLEWTNSGP